MKIHPLQLHFTVSFYFIYEDKLPHFNKRALKLMLTKGVGKRFVCVCVCLSVFLRQGTDRDGGRKTAVFHCSASCSVHLPR